MGRLEYAGIATAAPDVQQLAEQIALERGGRLINLYRTLLRRDFAADLEFGSRLAKS